MDPGMPKVLATWDRIRNEETRSMNLTLWPGKRLDLAEEAWLRDRVASLQRAENARADGWEGSRKERLSLERYLPENDATWTPDELEEGAHIGTWSDMAAGVSLNEPS
jgi:hypothetical protein